MADDCYLIFNIYGDIYRVLASKFSVPGGI